MRICLRFIASATLGLLMSLELSALSPEPAAAQDNAVVIVGVTIHVGNGEVIDNGLVTFSDGIITGVYRADAKPLLDGYQILDYSGKHLYPGFILPLSQLGLIETNSEWSGRDEAERGDLNPNVHVKYAYNTDSELIATLRFNGILTAQISPEGSLLAGQSSVMQLDAWNYEDALVLADDAMHLYWPKEYSSKMDRVNYIRVYKLNKSYESKIRSLKNLFNDAAAYDETERVNQKLAAVKKVLRGEIKLYIHGNSEKELLASLDFVRSQSLESVVMVGGQGLLGVAPLLRSLDIPVLVRGVHFLPGAKDDDVDISYQVPAKLLAAGLTVGLAGGTRMTPSGNRNLPFMAGHASAYGMTRAEALRMISLSNAEILGVADKLGSIEVGKQATLFVAEGDALDMRGNRLLVAFISGRSIELMATQQILHQRFKRKYSAD